MITLTVLTEKPQSPFYEQLLGEVDDQLLHLQDARGKFRLDKVHETNLQYFINQIIDKPWNNHLLLTIFVYTDRNSDVQSTKKILEVLNSRLKNLFDVFHLDYMTDLDTETHIYQYLKGSFYKEHSDDMRAKFLRYYRSVSYQIKKWITSKLRSEQQSYFGQFLFQTSRRTFSLESIKPTKRSVFKGL